jgi:hypothetical protein
MKLPTLTEAEVSRFRAMDRGRMNTSGLAEGRRRQAAELQAKLRAGKKWCSGCGYLKDFAEFHKSGRDPDGRQSRCKVCRKAAAA